MKTWLANIAIGFLSLAPFALAQASKDAAELKDALERFPQADTSGDGVLTMEEAEAFREMADFPERKKGGGKKKGRQADHGVSQIYKTVGYDKLELCVSAPKGHLADAKVPAIVFFHGGGPAGGDLSAATLRVDHFNAKTDPAGVSVKPNAMVLFNPGFGNRKQDGTDSNDPDGKGNLLNSVEPGQPPTIIFHGKDDITVPYTSVEEFTAVMKRAGNRCELLGCEVAGHSFFNQDKYDELTIAEADKFLTSLGWLQKR